MTRFIQARAITIRSFVDHGRLNAYIASFRTVKNSNGRLAQWLKYLTTIQFVNQGIAGSSPAVVDLLLRVSPFFDSTLGHMPLCSSFLSFIFSSLPRQGAIPSGECTAEKSQTFEKGIKASAPVSLRRRDDQISRVRAGEGQIPWSFPSPNQTWRRGLHEIDALSGGAVVF